MNYNTIFKKVKRPILIAFVVLLSGCIGPQVRMSVVHPPGVKDALKLKRIAMGEFEGKATDASSFSRQVEDSLAAVRIQGRPYFEMISAEQTARALQSENRSFKDLNSPDVARSIGISTNADGIFLGNVVRSGATDSSYQEQRSKCVRSETQYNKKGGAVAADIIEAILSDKGKAIGQDCVEWDYYMVDCIRRDARFEFVPNLIETETGRRIYSSRLTGSTSDEVCSDKGARIMSEVDLMANARHQVLKEIQTDLAPLEGNVEVEVMDSDSGLFDRMFGDGSGTMQAKESGKKFDSGYDYAKAGNMSRACEIWKDMETVEKEYAPLLHNIGLCEESAGKHESARDYFARAEKRSLKAESKISMAMARVSEQIESKQILTKSRPDIFYHAAKFRSVEEDQKLYKYSIPNTTFVKIRKAQALPGTVKIKNILKIVLDYSVMAPNGVPNAVVTESVVLKRDGRVIDTLHEEPITRPLGGCISEMDFKIPAGMPVGTYMIEQKIQSGTSTDLGSANFVVGL